MPIPVRLMARRLLLLACLSVSGVLPAHAVDEVPPTGISGEPMDSAFSDDTSLGSEDDFPADEDFSVVSDPLEKINRVTFWFNDKLYFYLLKPVARAYRVVPESIRVSVANFFTNLGSPVRGVNAVFQMKFADAGNEMGRFIINSTMGIGGLFDPAEKYAGIRETDEDFGQTLGAYGAGPGFYIVLPFLGPSSLRDGVGMVVDTGMSPLYNYAEREEKDNQYLVLKAVEAVNTVSLDKDTYESIKRDALDPYQFVRDAYVQNRQGKIRK
ncbi:MAG: lipoprotein [Gammaproteobacteria bacterium]|nr:MAG: lipoprotein [Gammaproteobacteria bacterium]TND06818.1 MAG: lipoprotein [Gammaproteobacteria bacterium]